MAQNRSTAVMQRRRVAPDSLDYFPTPPFATRALCEWLRGEGEATTRLRAWEPACGEMHMVRPLAEYFGEVRASDAHPYGDHELIDFPLTGRSEPQVDWVITNPPFRLAEDFIRTGLEVARRGVAVLLRTAFLEGEERHSRLFAHRPPSHVLQFVERVAMLEGRLVRKGAIDPFAEKPGTKAATATSYCWLVWRGGAEGGETRLKWIAPCMRRLERTGDYPDYRAAAEMAAAPLFDGLEHSGMPAWEMAATTTNRKDQADDR